MSSHKWMDVFFTNYMQKETKLFTIRAPKHEEKKKPECVKNMLLSNSVESVCLRWREQLTLFQPLCFCTETLILALQADCVFCCNIEASWEHWFPTAVHALQKLHAGFEKYTSMHDVSLQICLKMRQLSQCMHACTHALVHL